LLRLETDAGISYEYQDETGTVVIAQTEAVEGEHMTHDARVFASVDPNITRMFLSGSGENPLVSVYQQLPNLPDKDGYEGYFEEMGDNLSTAFGAIWATGAIINPSIDFWMHMHFDKQDEELKLFLGGNDGFPSYEVFARYDGGPWLEMYFWDSKTKGQTPFSLFGAGEISIPTPIDLDFTPD
jgi:hypothetical protein